MTSTHENLDWAKSSYSTTQENCVELAVTSSSVLLRDSKDPHGGVVRASRAALYGLLQTFR